MHAREKERGERNGGGDCVIVKDGGDEGRRGL